MVRGQPEQKVSKIPISPNKPGVVVCACHPSYAGVNRRIAVQVGLGKTLSEK
jgi:hypothetical protein